MSLHRSLATLLASYSGSALPFPRVPRKPLEDPLVILDSSHLLDSSLSETYDRRRRGTSLFILISGNKKSLDD